VRLGRDERERPGGPERRRRPAPHRARGGGEDGGRGAGQDDGAGRGWRGRADAAGAAVGRREWAWLARAAPLGRRLERGPHQPARHRQPVPAQSLCDAGARVRHPAVRQQLPHRGRVQSRDGGGEGVIVITPSTIIPATPRPPPPPPPAPLSRSVLRLKGGQHQSPPPPRQAQAEHGAAVADARHVRGPGRGGGGRCCWCCCSGSSARPAAAPVAAPVHPAVAGSAVVGVGRGAGAWQGVCIVQGRCRWWRWRSRSGRRQRRRQCTATPASPASPPHRAAVPAQRLRRLVPQHTGDVGQVGREGRGWRRRGGALVVGRRQRRGRRHVDARTARAAPPFSRPGTWWVWACGTRWWW